MRAVTPRLRGSRLMGSRGVPALVPVRASPEVKILFLHNTVPEVQLVCVCFSTMHACTLTCTGSKI